jgi:DNA-binding response OmpR family regulator
MPWILIIEPAEEVRSLTEKFLSCWRGYKVEGVETTEQALRLLGQKKFDLAIMDWGFNRLDHPRMLNEVKSVALATGRIIVTTAMGDDKGLHKNLSSVLPSEIWLDVIVKPYDVRHFRRRVAAALKGFS